MSWSPPSIPELTALTSAKTSPTRKQMRYTVKKLIRASIMVVIPRCDVRAHLRNGPRTGQRQKDWLTPPTRNARELLFSGQLRGRQLVQQRFPIAKSLDVLDEDVPDAF